MKYVFFGSPEFAAIILEKLIKAGMPPVAVVCNPDKPTGRKKILTPPPVKTRIMNQESGIRDKIKILQPKILDKSFLNSLFLIHDSFDVFVVAAYSKILPKEIIELPRLGTVGAHPSLLPKYRGATPIQSAILAGEKETGTTLFMIDEKVDHGAILATKRQATSDNETYESLLRKLAELSADLLIETLPKFVKGEITPAPQDEAQASYTKKFSSQDAYIDIEKENPETALRKIRAFNPEPGAWTMLNGKRTKILDAEIIKIRRPEGVGSPTEASGLRLKKIQVEGKKPREIP